MSWIPIREALPDDARVLSIADRLDIHPAHALGLCVTFWALASQQTADGRLERWTTGMIDRKVGQPGFAEAMIEVEWLERPAVSPPGFGADIPTLVIPRWDQYMGQASKARMQHARAQAKSAATKRAPGATEPAESPQPTAADSLPTTERRAVHTRAANGPTREPTTDPALDRARDMATATPTNAPAATQTPFRQDADGQPSANHQQRVRSASPREEKRREEKKSGGGAFARTPAPARTPPPDPGAPPPPLASPGGGGETGPIAELVAEGFTADDAAALVREHGADAVGLGLAVARHKRDHPAPSARPIANWRGLIVRAVTERWPAPIAMGKREPPGVRRSPQEAARATERAALAWWSAMGQDEREAAQARAAVGCEPSLRGRVTRETPHVGNVALAVLLHGLLAALARESQAPCLQVGAPRA